MVRELKQEGVGDLLLKFHELKSKVEIKSDYFTHDQVKATSMAGQ